MVDDDRRGRPLRVELELLIIAAPLGQARQSGVIEPGPEYQADAYRRYRRMRPSTPEAALEHEALGEFHQNSANRYPRSREPWFQAAQLLAWATPQEQAQSVR